MTLTKEQSSNKELYEAAPTSEIVNIIRNAMGAGCLRPSHVYDAVDELICRIEAMESKSKNVQSSNESALREALQTIHDKVNSLDEECGVDPIEVRDIARAALKKPPRQCDVGTAVEQLRRYCKFTDRYNPCSYKGNVRCAEDCPIHKKLTQEGHGELLCQLEWGQMPYEEVSK